MKSIFHQLLRTFTCQKLSQTWECPVNTFFRKNKQRLQISKRFEDFKIQKKNMNDRCFESLLLSAWNYGSIANHRRKDMPNIKDLFFRKNFQKIPDHDQAISSSTACSFETIEFLRKFASNIFPAYSRAVIPKRTIW